ncbi:hypothetical protein C8R44DRAFT_911537 [Mycena epipterygia]|nr:hypothetical protein C8R44DRAFT_911537 [Mycena epipterygia]
MRLARAVAAFFCILLGLIASITLSTAFSGTSSLASRTNDLFLPQIWPNHTLAEPSSRMDEIMRCGCGKTYTSEPHYTSHLNTCKRVLDENRRSWAIADSRKTRDKGSTRTAVTVSRRGDLDPARPAQERTGPTVAYEALTPDDSMPDYNTGVDSAQAHLPEADFRVPSPEPPQPPSLPAKRIRRPTAKALQALEDPLPEGPGPLQEDVASPEPETLTVRVPRLFRTAANSFGLSRIYRRKPTAIPDMDSVLDDRVAAGLKESSTAGPEKVTRQARTDAALTRTGAAILELVVDIPYNMSGKDYWTKQAYLDYSGMTQNLSACRADAASTPASMRAGAASVRVNTAPCRVNTAIAASIARYLDIFYHVGSS